VFVNRYDSVLAGKYSVPPDFDIPPVPVQRLFMSTWRAATFAPTGTTEAVAPEPPPPLNKIDGAEVYPLPSDVTLILETVPAVNIVAVAVAAVAPAFWNETVGAELEL